MYFVCRRAKVARVIGLLALHTSELGENVPVSEVTFHFIFFNIVNAFTFMSDFHCFIPCICEKGNNPVKFINLCVHSV